MPTNPEFAPDLRAAVEACLRLPGRGGLSTPEEIAARTLRLGAGPEFPDDNAYLTLALCHGLQDGVGVYGWAACLVHCEGGEWWTPLIPTKLWGKRQHTAVQVALVMLYRLAPEYDVTDDGECFKFVERDPMPMMPEPDLDSLGESPLTAVGQGNG